MSRLKRLILEIHRRSLWQVLAIYVGASWIVLQIVDVLRESFGLPEWFPALALALLLIGLPIVLATAFVQEGAPSIRSERGDPTLLPQSALPGSGQEPGRVDPAGRADAAGRVGDADTDARGLRGLFTWRNAIAGGVLAFSVWGVIATAWLLIGSPGLLVKAEAADFFNARDRVVVADLQNETDQEALGLAVREAIITDLDQSEYVGVVPNTEMREVLERMRLPDSTEITERVALEIARREGHPAVVAGSVAPLGSGYQLSARIIETATGEVAVRVRETAADGSEVVAAVEHLARLVRRHLGESLGSVRRSESLPQVTTSSLEALEFFARAKVYMDAGQQQEAIPLFQQAIRLDTTFAAAYRGLSIAYGNLGNLTDAQPMVEKAYRHGERLIDRERLLTAALHHGYRNQMDSMAHYYRLAHERYPDLDVAVNNLGDAYERMGRFEEALEYYREMVRMSPDKNVGYFNVAAVAGLVGHKEEAESAAAVLTNRFGSSPGAKWAPNMVAYTTNDIGRAESLLVELAADPDEFVQAWSASARAGLAGMLGQVARARALADSAASLAKATETPAIIYHSAQTASYLALASGQPDAARAYADYVEQQAEEEPPGSLRYQGLGMLAYLHATSGDLSAARAVLARMDSLAAAGNFHPHGIGEAARAVISLQENDPEAAIEHAQSARRQDFGMLRRWARLPLADAYAALGQYDRAVAQYDSVTTSARLFWQDAYADAVLRPLAHERLGSVYLAMGDTAAAVKHLAEFAEMWKDADPELQSRVEAARRTIERMAGEKS